MKAPGKRSAGNMLGTCLVTGKIRHGSHREARYYAKARKQHAATTAYRCADCGSWHLTSWTTRKSRAKTRYS